MQNDWLEGEYNTATVRMTKNSNLEGARWIVRSHRATGTDNRFGDCVLRKDHIALENNRPNAKGVRNFLDGARYHNNVRVQQGAPNSGKFFEIRSTLDSLGRTTNHGG